MDKKSWWFTGVIASLVILIVIVIVLASTGVLFAPQRENIAAGDTSGGDGGPQEGGGGNPNEYIPLLAGDLDCLGSGINRCDFKELKKVAEGLANGAGGPGGSTGGGDDGGPADGPGLPIGLEFEEIQSDPCDLNDDGFCNNLDLEHLLIVSDVPPGCGGENGVSGDKIGFSAVPILETTYICGPTDPPDFRPFGFESGDNRFESLTRAGCFVTEWVGTKVVNADACDFDNSDNIAGDLQDVNCDPVRCIPTSGDPIGSPLIIDITECVNPDINGWNNPSIYGNRNKILDVTGGDHPGSPQNNFTNMSDGLVEWADMWMVFYYWGSCGSGTGNPECYGDITGPDGVPEGMVSIIDFLYILSHWQADQNVDMVFTAQDLDQVRNNLNGDFVQMCDIDLSDYNGGQNFEPIGNQADEFTGEYDGNNYFINEFQFIDSDRSDVGLFGRVEHKITDRPKFTDIRLVNVDVVGRNSVGGLIGTGFRPMIKNSFAQGSVSGVESVGGLVGSLFGFYNNGIQFYPAEIIKGAAQGQVDGEFKVGGLVGDADNFRIENSYSNTDVIGDIISGGLVGQIKNPSNSRIINSYSNGIVNGEILIGGLVGFVFVDQFELMNVTNSYFDDDVYTGPNNILGEGRSTDHMTTFPHDGIDPEIWVDWTFVGVGSNSVPKIWKQIQGEYPWISSIGFYN